MIQGPRDGTEPVELVLATANSDKASEITEIVHQAAGEAIVLLERPDSIGEVDETGTTLMENALLKAKALVEGTGMPALADDTGLEVDALGGAPGVYSSRYSGENASYAENISKLLEELDRVGARDSGQRRARFRTVAVALFPDGKRITSEGTVEGRIAVAPTGEAGFGYDPVFVPDDGDGRSFAQMTATEKHAMSHRGRAFRAVAVGILSR